MLWKSTASSDDISKVYGFGRVLGEGLTGVVRKGHLLSDPSVSYAIKAVDLQTLSGPIARAVANEVMVMKETDNPYIVNFFECYQNKSELFIVMEYCPGGDLVTLVERGRLVEESVCRRLFWQAATAVNYLHHFGICHRDVKLENFLLTDPDPAKADLKLIDFGFACRFRQSEMKTPVGTTMYIAPEVFEQKYDQACDLWSLGVMLYILVTGKPLFCGHKPQQVYEAIKTRDLDFVRDRALAHVSADCKKLLGGLLQRDPRKRYSFSDVFRSSWFKATVNEVYQQWTASVTKELLMKLTKQQSAGRFQREVILLAVKIQFAEPRVAEARRLFCLLDSLNNGVLTVEELREAFLAHDVRLSPEEVEGIVRSLELNSEGVLTYTEFIRAIIAPGFFTEDRILASVFSRIDVGGTGYISKEDIRSCFERFGHSLTQEAVDDFMEAMKPSSPGAKATMADLKGLMLSLQP